MIFKFTQQKIEWWNNSLLSMNFHLCLSWNRNGRNIESKKWLICRWFAKWRGTKLILWKLEYSSDCECRMMLRIRADIFKSVLNQFWQAKKMQWLKLAKWFHYAHFLTMNGRIGPWIGSGNTSYFWVEKIWVPVINTWLEVQDLLNECTFKRYGIN